MTNKPHTTSTDRRDHYAELTNRVIALLEAGTLPWRRPWDPDKAGGPAMPCNAVTGARYRGINVVTLGMSSLAFSRGDPRWATYKQAADRGWQVQKGARGTTAFFFKRIEVRDGTGGNDDPGPGGGEETAKHIPLLRSFSLFHASQIDGIPAFTPPTIEQAPWRAPDAVDTIIGNSGAIVRIGGGRAFYSPSTDHIQIPPPHAFSSATSWSSVIIHEAAHWSGAPHRLDRNLKSAFGSHDYAREELRAEIAQSMVCAELGLACDWSNAAAYVGDWLTKLKSDRKEIFRAAADAQRIADYLLAFHPAYRARETGNDPANTAVDADGSACALAEAA